MMLVVVGHDKGDFSLGRASCRSNRPTAIGCRRFGHQGQAVQIVHAGEALDLPAERVGCKVKNLK